MDDVRFYFIFYDKHLSAPFDAKDFDRLHKFYLRPRHKMDRRGGKKTIRRRMCSNGHRSLWSILEYLRKRARRDLGDEKLARPAQYVPQGGHPPPPPRVLGLCEREPDGRRRGDDRDCRLGG